MDATTYLKKFVDYLEDLSEKLSDDEDFREIVRGDVDSVASLLRSARDLRNQSGDTYGDVKSFVADFVIDEGRLNDDTQPFLEGRKFDLLCRNSASSSVDRQKLKMMVKRQIFESFESNLTEAVNEVHVDEDASLEDALEDALQFSKQEMSEIVDDLIDECTKSNGLKIGGIRDMESKDEDDGGLRLKGIVSKPSTKEVNHLDDPSYVDVKENEEADESEDDLVMEDEE